MPPYPCAELQQQSRQRSSLSPGALLVQQAGFLGNGGNGQSERGADRMHDRQTCGVVGPGQQLCLGQSSLALGGIAWLSARHGQAWHLNVAQGCPKAFSPTSQRSPKGPERKAPSPSSAIPFNHRHEPATRTGVSSRGAQSRRRLGSFVELPVVWLEPGSVDRVRLSPELGTGLGGGWALGAGFLHHQRDISANPGQAVVFHRVFPALLSRTATPELLVSNGHVSLLACTRSHWLIFQRPACLALSSLETDCLTGVAVAVAVVARRTELGAACIWASRSLVHMAHYRHMQKQYAVCQVGPRPGLAAVAGHCRLRRAVSSMPHQALADVPSGNVCLRSASSLVCNFCPLSSPR